MVSIGLPTHERAAMLSRALASALSQTHARLQVVISDNASSDGTEEVCRAAAERDPRVLYLRQERNIGPTANFNRLFAACAGDYVLLLADDDWLEPNYVAACLAELKADSEMALAAGRASYMRSGRFVHDGIAHQHCQADPAERVRDYLATVEDNGVFYGLMPREVLERACPLPNVLGNDWLHVARIACQGHIRVLEEVRIHRELGGTSVDVNSIISTFGGARWHGRLPQLVIAWHLLRDIGWDHGVYARLGRRRRLVLGIVGAITSIRWRGLAWHLATPLIANVARRPRGRWVWMLYDRLTRTLGAGQRP